MAKKRKPKRRRQRARVAADIAGLISGVGWLVWMFSYSIAALLFAIVSALCAGVAAVWSRQETVATTKAPATPSKPKVYKSKRQRARERRSQVLAGQVRSGWTRTGAGGLRGCNSRCQNSRAPVSWCRCPCGGQGHGRARGLGVALGAATSPRAKETPARPQRKPARRERQSAADRAVEPRSAARPIRYRARDGKEYTATATPRQVAQLRGQGRYLGPA